MSDTPRTDKESWWQRGTDEVITAGWMVHAEVAQELERELTAAMKEIEELRKFVSTPPAAQREWVGLTLKEFKQIEERHIFVEDTIRFVEAKLKEKNT
jgi:hypothetical protein